MNLDMLVDIKIQPYNILMINIMNHFSALQLRLQRDVQLLQRKEWFQQPSVRHLSKTLTDLVVMST